MKTHTTPECYPCIHSKLWQIRSSYFSGWCFTHQYKNTTQFCFYAVPAASQNTKSQKIREIQYGMVFMPVNSKEIAASEVIFDSEFSEPPIVVCSIRSDTILTEYGRLFAFICNDDIKSKGLTVRVSNYSYNP